MNNEIRKDLTVLQDEMGDKIAQFENIGEDRLKLIVAHSAIAIKHFFDTGVYGDLEKSTPDTLPAYWPYVRFLVYDALKPRFEHGDSQFVTQRYSDKFLEDIVGEALAITASLPKDMTHQEWKFFVDVSAHMMMVDPFFIEQGLVTKKGQEAFMSQSFMAGMALMAGDDMYEVYLTQWKNNFAVGLRDAI